MSEHQYVYLLLNGSKHCTVPRGAVYAEVCTAVRDRLGLKADTELTMTLPNGDVVQLGEDLVDCDRVSVNVGTSSGEAGSSGIRAITDVGAGGHHSTAGAGGRRIVQAETITVASSGEHSAPPTRTAGRAGASSSSAAASSSSSTSAGRTAAAAAAAGAGAGAAAGAAAAGVWEFDENRPLSPTEKLSASKWLSAVASPDTGLASLRSAAGLKSINASEVHLPKSFDRAGCPAAQPYLENLGLSFPTLGHLLSSRTSSGVMSQVSRICTSATDAIANQPNVEAVRPVAHSAVVVLLGSRDADGRVPNHPSIGELGKQLRNIIAYTKCYTDKGFLRKHLKGGEYKTRVDYFTGKARTAMVSFVRDTYPTAHRQPTIDAIERSGDLGIGVLEELDVVVDRYTAERTDYVQAVSAEEAAAALEHRAFVVRDRGEGHVLDAPDGAHYVVMFKRGADIVSFGITNRALDEAWVVDQEFPKEDGKLHVTKPSTGVFDGTRSEVYDRMDEILASVAELEGIYTSDSAFLEAATAADE